MLLNELETHYAYVCFFYLKSLYVFSFSYLNKPTILPWNCGVLHNLPQSY